MMLKDLLSKDGSVATVIEIASLAIGSFMKAHATRIGSSYIEQVDKVNDHDHKILIKMIKGLQRLLDRRWDEREELLCPKHVVSFNLFACWLLARGGGKMLAQEKGKTLLACWLTETDKS